MTEPAADIATPATRAKRLDARTPRKRRDDWQVYHDWLRNIIIGADKARLWGVLNDADFQVLAEIIGWETRKWVARVARRKRMKKPPQKELLAHTAPARKALGDLSRELAAIEALGPDLEAAWVPFQGEAVRALHLLQAAIEEHGWCLASANATGRPAAAWPLLARRSPRRSRHCCEGMACARGGGMRDPRFAVRSPRSSPTSPAST